MIVVYKEIESVGLFHDGNRSIYKYEEHSTVNREVRELRKLYGVEKESIDGKAGNGICMVYDDCKYYIVSVGSGYD